MQQWAIVVSVVGSFVSTTLATLAFVARLIYTGRLVPKSLHDQVRQDRDERVARADAIADEYRSLARTAQETITAQGVLLTAIAETTKTTHAVVNALSIAADRATSDSRGMAQSPSPGSERVA